MAKQLLEQVKQAEMSAQARMEKAKQDADRLVRDEKEKCCELEQQRAAGRAQRAADAVCAAEKQAADEREQILKAYEKQEQTLCASAGERIPQAVAYVTAWMIGS